MNNDFQQYLNRLEGLSKAAGAFATLHTSASPSSSFSLEKMAATTVQHISKLRDTVNYNLTLLDEQLANFNELAPKTVEELLEARGFAYAAAGLHNEAITDLNAVVASKGTDTPRVLNKLAQVLLRRGREGDNEAAKKYASLVNEMSSEVSADDKWLSLHLLSGISMAQKQWQPALDYAEKALEVLNDPRTLALKGAAEVMTGSKKISDGLPELVNFFPEDLGSVGISEVFSRGVGELMAHEMLPM